MLNELLRALEPEATSSPRRLAQRAVVLAHGSGQAPQICLGRHSGARGPQSLIRTLEEVQTALVRLVWLAGRRLQYHLVAVGHFDWSIVVEAGARFLTNDGGLR